MSVIKKKNTFAALATLIIVFNAYSMEQLPKRLRWVLNAAEVMLGLTNPREFLLAIHNQQVQPPTTPDVIIAPDEPFLFTELPQEMQNHIISLLVITSTAQTATQTAEAISSLAQTNKALNAKINNPDFCLQIIKHLAKKFNCSDFEACTALSTQQAKKQLLIQKNLFDLCCMAKPSEHLFGICLSQGPDFSFSYQYHKGLSTPLHIAVLNSSNMINLLCNTNPDIINYIGPVGLSPLMLTEQKGLWWGAQQLFEYPSLNINQQNAQGNTALMYAIKSNNPKNVLNLLAHGADPELANFAQETPLAIAQRTNSPKIIELIQNEIARKHGKITLSK